MLNKIKSAYLKAGNYCLYFLHEYFLQITAVIITVLSLGVRFAIALHPTRDVVAYVFEWMKDIQEVGFSNFYKVQSDYSPLFLFIVGIFTLLPAGKEITVGNLTFNQNWMYYVKGTYFLAEIGIAVGIFLLIRAITNDSKRAWLGYIVYLCLPVQLFNSAVWGNADTLYFICFVYALYFVVKGKSGLAFFITGVCFGIKLQAVFLLPFLAYATLSGKLKLYKIFAFPLGVLATFIPAYACGAGLFEPFNFWLEQMGGYSLLTLGCANIWHLINIKSGSMEQFLKGATLFGLLLIGLFTAIVFARKVKLTSENTLLVAVFLIAIVPMFLPHMHERYFYALDVLVAVYCIVTKKQYYLIVLMQLSSGIAYHNYLSGRHFILAFGEDSVHIASWINIFVLCTLFYNILKLPTEGTLKDRALYYKMQAQSLSTNPRENENKN